MATEISRAGSLRLETDCVARWTDYRDGTVSVYVEINGIEGARIGKAQLQSGQLSEQWGKRVSARDWARVRGAIEAQIRGNARRQ